MNGMVDIPCDVHQRGPDGLPFAFLDEAGHPEAVRLGALVVTGDDEEPVVAQVAAVTDSDQGTRISLRLLPGVLADYEDLVRRAHAAA